MTVALEFTAAQVTLIRHFEVLAFAEFSGKYSWQDDLISHDSFSVFSISSYVAEKVEGIAGIQRSFVFSGLKILGY